MRLVIAAVIFSMITTAPAMAHDQPDGEFEPVLVGVEVGDGTLDLDLHAHATGGAFRLLAPSSVTDVSMVGESEDGLTYVAEWTNDSDGSWSAPIDVTSGFWDFELVVDSAAVGERQWSFTLFLPPERPEPTWPLQAIAVGLPPVGAALWWLATRRRSAVFEIQR